jgi:hypothetical protein
LIPGFNRTPGVQTLAIVAAMAEERIIKKIADDKNMSF